MERPKLEIKKVNFDSSKLMHHPERVSEWRRGDLIYPIYAEVASVGFCNHRCAFCAEDFMDYQRRFWDADLLETRLGEMAKGGLKSVMFAGEGEPLLHPRIAEIVNFSKAHGVDTAFTTNGVALTRKFIEASLANISWIKVSIDAGTPSTHAKIHGTSERDFPKIWENLSYAVRFRRENGLACTLGSQLLLLPENRAEVETLAQIAGETGIDYLVVKPYSQHPSTLSRKYANLHYVQEDLELADRLSKYNRPGFNVQVRQEAIQNIEASDKERGYNRCQALSFWSYIDAGGNVWGCSVYLGDERFLYGNLKENTFAEIWLGEKRRRSLDFVANELDATKCRKGCRLHNDNIYLWQLTHPHPHVNFI